MSLARRQLEEAVHAVVEAGENVDDVAAATLLSAAQIRRLARR